MRRRCEVHQELTLKEKKNLICRRRKIIILPKSTILAMNHGGGRIRLWSCSWSAETWKLQKVKGDDKIRWIRLRCQAILCISNYKTPFNFTSRLLQGKTWDSLERVNSLMTYASHCELVAFNVIILTSWHCVCGARCTVYPLGICRQGLLFVLGQSYDISSMKHNVHMIPTQGYK